MAIQEGCGRVAQLHGLSSCLGSEGLSSGDATRAKRFGMHIPVDARLPAILVISHSFYVAHMQRQLVCEYSIRMKLIRIEVLLECLPAYSAVPR